MILKKLGEDTLEPALGDIRITDMDKKGVPLAVTIGVGGVQGLIAVLTATGMTDEARQAVLEIVFGILPADAKRMSVTPEATDTGTGGEGTETEETETTSAE